MSKSKDRNAELSRIYKRDKSLKPSVVVDEAKPKQSVLHDDFEWNDKKAAIEHRLQTARHIIKVAKITVAPNKPCEVVIHVPKESKTGCEGE